jgi:hypothetical protein
MPPRYPSLYQINTRVRLTALSRQLGRPATLDDIPDAELDALAELGFDWIWLLSVWRIGTAGRQVSRVQPEWRRAFQETLADLQEEDIAGSGFAITGYTVAEPLGGDAALARLRERLRARGLRLMLDFVPNHMGLDHPWVEDHPEYFVPGNRQDQQRAPQNYIAVQRKQGELLLAHGRDPYFSGWPDTLQVNYAEPAAQQAMSDELLRIAGQCDGVRCDMAMLVLPEVFERTWGLASQPFWPQATQRVRERFPEFCFMAEVYWDMEWTLQQQGFDYAYDKRLYDRLREAHARPAREHLYAGLDYQDKLARFLENHDETRAAAAFPPGIHEAAAAITFLAPGLRFFHEGQMQGRKKHVSPHLVRAPEESTDSQLEQFYQSLLAVLRRPAVREGAWRLLECQPAWEGNWTWDCFIAFAWEGPDAERLLVAVNYAPNQSQCRVHPLFPGLAGHAWRLQDLLGGAAYTRDGGELQAQGLYLDMRPWQACVFALSRQDAA